MRPELDLDVTVTAGPFQARLTAQVPRGPIAVVGPNGAGKTTLLRALAGGPLAAAGRIAVRGRTLLDTARGVRRPPEARRVGYLPQTIGLFPHLSALDNVAYGVRGSRRERREAARAWLHRLDLATLADRRARHLSGGERQRVALARALAAEPALLLLDEPTAALDITVRHALRPLLATILHDRERTAIVVTHDPRDLRAWSPHLLLVDGGRVVRSGPLATLAADPRHPFLEALLETGAPPPGTAPSPSGPCP